MSMSEYRKTDPQDLICNEDVGGCGREFTAAVSVHKLSGVAGVTCPHCGKTQEPMRRTQWRSGS